jgi:hypothetical protein
MSAQRRQREGYKRAGEAPTPPKLITEYFDEQLKKIIRVYERRFAEGYNGSN